MLMICSQHEARQSGLFLFPVVWTGVSREREDPTRPPFYIWWLTLVARRAASLPSLSVFLQSLSAHVPPFHEGNCTFYMATGFQDNKHKSCQPSKVLVHGTMSIPAHFIGQSKLQDPTQSQHGWGYECHLFAKNCGRFKIHRSYGVLSALKNISNILSLSIIK